MAIKLTNLKMLFPFNKEVADILGVTRQAIDQVHEFNNKKKVKKLEIATDKRMKEIQVAYRTIKKAAKKVLQDDST